MKERKKKSIIIFVYDVALRHNVYGSLPSLYYYGRYTAMIFVLAVVSSFQPHTRTRAPAEPKAESPRSFQPRHTTTREGRKKCNGVCATLQKLHRVVHIHQFTRYKRIIIIHEGIGEVTRHIYIGIYTVANGHSLYPCQIL